MATLQDILGPLAALFPKNARISEANYNALVTVDPSTAYWIKDKGYIMQNGVRYPSAGALGGGTLDFDTLSRVLKLTNADGTTSTATIPDIDNYVVSGTLNAATGTITFVFKDGGTFDVPIGAIVKLYTGGETDTAKVSVGAGEEITAAVKISAAAGNALTVKPDGLHVPTPPALPIVSALSPSSTDAQVLGAASLFTALSALGWQEL